MFRWRRRWLGRGRIRADDARISHEALRRIGRPWRRPNTSCQVIRRSVTCAPTPLGCAQPRTIASDNNAGPRRAARQRMTIAPDELTAGSTRPRGAVGPEPATSVNGQAPLRGRRRREIDATVRGGGLANVIDVVAPVAAPAAGAQNSSAWSSADALTASPPGNTTVPTWRIAGQPRMAKVGA